MPNTNELTIYLDELHNLSVEGEKLAIEPKAEVSVMKLVFVKLLAEQYIKAVKENLITEAGKIMPGFKGFVGQHLKATYRSYGSKYKYIDDGSEPDPNFVTKKTTFSVDSKEVDEYVSKTGKLPEGITEADREPQLAFNESDLEELFKEGTFLEQIRGIERLLSTSEQKTNKKK